MIRDGSPPWSCRSAFVVGGAPLLAGLIRQVRARLEGRAGPPIVQPWRDLRKLWRKERIAPEHTSWVFLTAPLVLVVDVGSHRDDRAAGDVGLTARSRG